MKVIIDNNIIRHANIEKIKKTNILKKVQKGEITFYACAKIFSQLIPFLRHKCKNRQIRQEVVNFFFDLINKQYMFPSIAEIANREISMLNTGNLIDNFWFDKYTPDQIKNMKNNLSLQQALDSILEQGESEFSKEDIKQAHMAIKTFQENNYNLIKQYCKQTYQNIDNNIRFEAQKIGFDEKNIEAFTNIVKSVDDKNLNNEKRKEKIYKNLFDKLLEYNLLISLKNQIVNKEKHILLNDVDYINNYYKNYNDVNFTKLIIEATKYGYSYKVNNPNCGYDDDWINDTSYICCATFVDILLTDDTKYLKDAFKYIWRENKKIMTLDEFISEYC